jgi:hypothetical protein
MLGSAVSKGIESLEAQASHSGLASIIFVNKTVNQSQTYDGNQTGYQTTVSSAADDTADVSDEELELRLQFAMSVTFMSGVIQVKYKKGE